MGAEMKPISFVILLLVISGGIDLGLLGLTGVDFLGLIFGGRGTAGAQIAYCAIGLSAAFQLSPLLMGMHSGEQTRDGN